MKTGSGSRILLLPLLLATFFWALGHPLGRIILQTVHPFQLSTMTLTVGFLCVLCYLAAAPAPSPSACLGSGRTKSSPSAPWRGSPPP
jgi:hypothetical protein